MSDAKKHILGRIRHAVGGKRGPEWKRVPDKRLLQPPALIRPKLAGDRIAHFRDKLEISGGSLEQLEHKAQVGEAIRRFLESHRLDISIRAAPALQGLLDGTPLAVTFGPTRGEHLVAVTPAFCAVAETGSVVLLSGKDSPTSLNFLPDYHIVIIEQAQLLTHMEEVWARLRTLDEMPRTVNFITGPSKTADIEQTLQIGAHGPRSFHVLFVRGQPI